MRMNRVPTPEEEGSRLLHRLHKTMTRQRKWKSELLDSHTLTVQAARNKMKICRLLRQSLCCRAECDLRTNPDAELVFQHKKLHSLIFSNKLKINWLLVIVASAQNQRQVRVADSTEVDFELCQSGRFVLISLFFWPETFVFWFNRKRRLRTHRGFFLRSTGNWRLIELKWLVNWQKKYLIYII